MHPTLKTCICLRIPGTDFRTGQASRDKENQSAVLFWPVGAVDCSVRWAGISTSESFGSQCFLQVASLGSLLPVKWHLSPNGDKLYDYWESRFYDIIGNHHKKLCVPNGSQLFMTKKDLYCLYKCSRSKRCFLCFLFWTFSKNCDYNCLAVFYQ